MKKKNDVPRITLLELAQQILALPPEQRALEAHYHMRDDRGYETQAHQGPTSIAWPALDSCGNHLRWEGLAETF